MALASRLGSGRHIAGEAGAGSPVQVPGPTAWVLVYQRVNETTWEIVDLLMKNGDLVGFNGIY